MDTQPERHWPFGHDSDHVCSLDRNTHTQNCLTTLLYIDNQATMHMINDDKPMPRSCHIDIQYFAIQEWHEAGILKVEHIPGVINPSDAATTALASHYIAHTCDD
jgi:hypothetical protein